jgi:hypothetical protein
MIEVKRTKLSSNFTILSPQERRKSSFRYFVLLLENQAADLLILCVMSHPKKPLGSNSLNSISVNFAEDFCFRRRGDKQRGKLLVIKKSEIPQLDGSGGDRNVGHRARTVTEPAAGDTP